MESRRIAAGAVLLAALVVLLLNSSASSCVPDDFGKCEKFRERARVSWLGGGGKGNATLILAANQNTLKSNLLEFANVNRKSGWGDADSAINQFAPKPPTVLRRTPEFLHLSQLTQVELDRAENKIYMRFPETSLIQVRQLERIANERARRVQERALAQIRFTPVRVAPKPVEVVQPEHVPAAPQPGSPDPYNAPAPSGTWVHIPPYTSVWYSIDDRGRRINLWMDADRNSGLIVAVYGPDVADVWNARPTGIAAPADTFAYFWTGRSRFKGMWRVRVTNPNDYSVPYSLTAANISDKNGDLCRDCHGIIEDEWERCEHDGSFCEDLKDQFAN